MNLKDFWDFWYGKSPPVRVNAARDDDLYEASATRGCLIIGDPGSGKTRYAAMQIFKRWKANPHPTFVFDSSGGLRKCLEQLIARDKDGKKLMENVVVDEIGHPQHVIPKPEFHPDYGLTDEEQVSRVVDNMVNLAEHMATTATYITTVAITEIGKQLFRLLQVIRNEYGERWQITEAMELLNDQNMLKRACQKFGQYAIPAKKYFEKQYLPKDVMNSHDRYMMTTALKTMLGMIDSDIARATLGHYKPGWTPKEADEKNLLVIMDANEVMNIPAAKAWLITSPFSQILRWVNKRKVDDPNNKLLEIYFDETVDILAISGFAKAIGNISPYYRSRRVSLTIIIQALWQLDEKLQEQVWNMANVVSFVVSNVNDAEIIAKQLFEYDSKRVKLPAKTEHQNPTTESVAGGDRITADFLQNLPPRSFVMRRYLDEQKKEKGVQLVERTDDFPNNSPYISIEEMRQYQREKYTVPIRDSLEVIKAREDLLKEDKSDPDF